MTKYNRGTVAGAPRGPVTTERFPTGRTALGHPGYARDKPSELFLLAVTYTPEENTHHEMGVARDQRFIELVKDVAVTHPEWMVDFLTYLRLDTGMRSGAIVAAAEAAHARLEAGEHGATRQMVDAVLQRADEPGEFLAYWWATFGRGTLPKPVKRGLADAVWRLYSEWSVLKYDSPNKPIRFADVIGLVRPTGSLHDTEGTKPIKGTWRGVLYDYLRRQREVATGAVMLSPELRMLTARVALMATPADLRREWLRPDVLKAAGMTHQAVGGWLEGPMDSAVWSACIPNMGYMALLMNLRNFDQAGVSDVVARQVGEVLATADNVRKSRVRPLQFLAAYRAAPSLRWSWPLEQALGYSLDNVPELDGHTLVMVDTSSSMNDAFSKDGTMRRWDAAALFGIALARRCARVDLVSYSSAQKYYNQQPGERSQEFLPRAGESLLTALTRWRDGGYFLEGGTETARSLRARYTTHDRVVLITDEQAGQDPIEVNRSVPAQVPMYTLNLAGYEHGHAPTGPNRYCFGGLTDSMFDVIRLIEAGQRSDWHAVFTRRRDPVAVG
jgi:hypothetical protein